MDEKDTISLLRECDAGTKMAVTSIQEVLDKTHDSELKKVLSVSREHHEKLGKELHAMLLEKGSEEKDPSPMAKGMSWLKTNVKVGMEEKDSAIADILTDGCNMGIKSLHKYRNQYKDAEDSALKICDRLIDIEEELCKDLQKYL
jgi:DNA-binding PucR family transcriptional regulator